MKLLRPHDIVRFTIVLYVCVHHVSDNSGIFVFFYISCTISSQFSTSVIKYEGLILGEKVYLQNCKSWNFISCLDMLEPHKAPNAQLWVPLFSPDMPSTYQLILLSAKPAEPHLVLSLRMSFTSLSAGKIIQTNQSATFTENESTLSSCDYKPTSHGPCWVTLLPSATPMWSCMVCVPPLAE